MATKTNAMDAGLLSVAGTVIAGAAVTAAVMLPRAVYAYGEHILLAFYLLLLVLLLLGVALVYIGIWASSGRRAAIAKAAVPTSLASLALAVSLAGLAALEKGLLYVAGTVYAYGEHIVLAFYLLLLMLLLLGVSLVYIGIWASSSRVAIAKAAVRTSLVPLALAVSLAAVGK